MWHNSSIAQKDDTCLRFLPTKVVWRGFHLRFKSQPEMQRAIVWTMVWFIYVLLARIHSFISCKGKWWLHIYIGLVCTTHVQRHCHLPFGPASGPDLGTTSRIYVRILWNTMTRQYKHSIFSINHSSPLLIRAMFCEKRATLRKHAYSNSKAIYSFNDMLHIQLIT